MKKKKETSKFIRFTAKWLLILSAASFLFIVISNKTHKPDEPESITIKNTLDKQLDSIIRIQFPEAKIETIGELETLDAGKESLPSYKAVQELEMTLETLLQIDGIDSDIVKDTQSKLQEARNKLASEETKLKHGKKLLIRRVNIINPDGTHTTFFQRKISDDNNSEIIELYNY